MSLHHCILRFIPLARRLVFGVWVLQLWGPFWFYAPRNNNWADFLANFCFHGWSFVSFASKQNLPPRYQAGKYFNPKQQRVINFQNLWLWHSKGDYSFENNYWYWKIHVSRVEFQLAPSVYRKNWHLESRGCSWWSLE